METDQFDFLVSRPDADHPNRLEVLDGDGRVVFATSHVEKNDGYPAYAAYAPAGVAEGSLVYAGFGRKEDFEFLKAKGVRVKGCVVLVRYGKARAVDVAFDAKDVGAAGVVIYRDPQDAAPFGRGEENVYPNKIFMPGLITD